MNVNRDPDSILDTWLDEGPTDLPDATRRAILTALPTTPQARRGPFAPGPFLRLNTFAGLASTLVVAALAIGVLALIAGPRGGVGTRVPSPSPAPSTTATAPPLPTLDVTFVSSSYGYQVRYPAGWSVTNGNAPWPPGTDRLPGNSVSDSIITPSGPERVRFSGASIALVAGTTMDQFRAFASPLSSPFNPSPCSPIAPLPVPPTIAYVSSPGASPSPAQAVVGVNGCDALAELGGHIYDVEVIAGGRGYTFTIDGHITAADALAWLTTITLEPSSVPNATAAQSPLASN